MGETFSKPEGIISNDDVSNNGTSRETNNLNEAIETAEHYSNIYNEPIFHNNSSRTNQESQLEEMAVVTSSYLERDLEMHHYECNICGLNFTSRHRLRKHALLHDSQRRFPCTLCDKSFATLANLRNHIKTHPMDENPFECNFCDKTFAYESSLHVHMKDHTGVYTHTCEICCKTFTQKSYFMCHMWTHTEKRPHKCHFCDKIFFLPSNLRLHVKAHSQNNEYALNDCDFSNNSQSSIMAS